MKTYIWSCLIGTSLIVYADINPFDVTTNLKKLEQEHKETLSSLNRILKKVKASDLKKKAQQEKMKKRAAAKAAREITLKKKLDNNLTKAPIKAKNTINKNTKKREKIHKIVSGLKAKKLQKKRAAESLKKIAAQQEKLKKKRKAKSHSQIIPKVDN